MPHIHSHQFKYKFTPQPDEIRAVNLWFYFVYNKMSVIVLCIACFFLISDILYGNFSILSFVPIVLLAGVNYYIFGTKYLIRKNPDLLNELEYDFTDKGMNSASTQWNTFLTWETVPKVIETNRFIYIFVNSRCVKFLPKRVIAIEKELQDLREFLSSKTKFEQR
jgi:hypothetical protein